MNKYIYLSLTPEALIASMLSPVEFGNYLAVGTSKRTRGQAIFVEIDMDKIDTLPFDYITQKLVPYEDGAPKRSVYLSIYRVLEQVPLDAFKSLYLVTDDGKVLEIKPGLYKGTNEDMVHLYQQFNPICTRVASKLSPPEFIEFLTDTSKPVSVPKVLFAELRLDKLAKDPNAPIHNLPYPNPDHLRDCLTRLEASRERLTKTVIRNYNRDLSYRTIRDGFFAGAGKEYLFYPFPSIKELEDNYYYWWRSALVQCF